MASLRERIQNSLKKKIGIDKLEEALEPVKDREPASGANNVNERDQLRKLDKPANPKKKKESYFMRNGKLYRTSE